MEPTSAEAAALAFEHLPLPVLLLDEADRLVRANASARQAFGAPAPGTPLSALGPELASQALPETGLRIACLMSADAARVADLSRAAGSAGNIAHEIKNANSAVNLALRAVARQLGEDEVEVLEDLEARLCTVEQRIRTALSSAPGG